MDLSNGADVISCSWGPVDGGGGHHGPAALSQGPCGQHAVAIDAAATSGRAGAGCVVLFAAATANESVDNDGYASHGR